MAARRRAQYRVELDNAVGLKVVVSNPKGPPMAGHLVDVSGSGAGVRFEVPEAPNLAVGQIVDLVFTSEQLSNPLTVAATVQHRTEEEDRSTRRYGFRFLQAQQLESHLPPKLREFFNRRRALRVAPDPYKPIQVSMQAPDADAPLEVRLENLSELGCRISLERELEPSFADTTLVELTLELPDVKEPLLVSGDIRYRRLVGRRIQYGIEFSAKRCRNFETTRGILAKYVAERFQEMVRSSAA